MEIVNSKEADILKKIAYKSIETYLENIEFNVDKEFAIPENLKINRGAFVSLHLERRLRGCIGYIEPIMPLYLAVFENARNAAFRDPRFPPLTKEEFKRIEIEISILSNPQPIKCIEEFVVGEHGIILKKGPHQAVFLPQVAPEQGWDRDTTLRYLSLKAGLPEDAYKDRDCKFEIFYAQIIK